MKNKKVFVGGVICILLLVILLAGCVVPKQTMVPMRDGVKLATDLYVKKGTQPHGAILIRTPYNKLGLLTLGMNWAQSGWPTVGQDMRGRFASEGIDTVFKNDHTDGPDTLAWIANQTWSNGKIATFGASALGITQYLTAGANPPNLACQYIQVATPNMYKHAMYPGGEFRKNMIEEWLRGQGDEAFSMLPEIWAHENYTMDYWTNVSLDDNWQDVNVPAIHIGGWYDIFTQGTIDGFLGYQHQGGPGAIGKSKLIIGPWTHGGAVSMKQGELKYPANSVDNFSQTLFWQMVDEYTMNGPTDFDSWPAVTYYVMGDVNDSNASGNEWRNADDWPIPCIERAWFFQADGTLQTTIPADTQQFTYTYNPTHPVPTIGGGNLNIPCWSL